MSVRRGISKLDYEEEDRILEIEKELDIPIYELYEFGTYKICASEND